MNALSARLSARRSPTLGQPTGSIWSSRAVGLLDQVVSGLSNVLAVVIVARALNAADFGRFSLAYATLTVTLTLSRALLGTRISLASSAAEARAVTSRLVGDVLLVSPVLAAAVLGTALAMTGGRSLGLLLLVACAAPLVCAQDLMRFGAVSAGRPGRALLSDGVWLVIVAAPLLVRAQVSAAGALAVWLAGTVGALVVALATAGGLPRFSASLGELRRRSVMGESVLIGTAFTAAVTLAVLLVVGRLLGPTAAGALRGAATTMAPVNVLLAFVSLGLSPALVRRSRDKDVRFCLSAAAVLLGCSVAWSGMLLLMPADWGAAALGKSWSGVRHVLPWTAGEYALLCVGATASLGLKVRDRPRELVLQRMVSGAVALIGGTALALTGADVRAVAAALATSAAVLAGLAWLQLARAAPTGSTSGRVP